MTRQATKNNASASAPAVRNFASFVGLAIASATVFISSACIMVIELVAGRLIAKFLGSSLYTWTSIIGVVLAGIAVGNYWGGRIADRYAVGTRSTRRTIALLFILAAGTSIFITSLNDFTGERETLASLTNWPLRVALHIGLVFFIPSGMLGLISPVVAKMALDLGRTKGRTIGSVYAWGVVGSILGTFLTGYYLVAVFPTSSILIGVALVLLIMGLIYGIGSLVSK